MSPKTGQNWSSPKRRKKKYLINDGHKVSKFGKNYELTDARSSINPKHKKRYENYTNIHHNQTAQNQ